MRIKFLGTGGWYPKYSQTACVLVQTRRANFVFDLGTGAAHLKDELDLTKETHVLISHFHHDHFVGINYLLGVFRGKKITVWGQKGIEKVARAYLSPPLFPIPIEKHPFEFIFGELDGGEREIAGARVRSAELKHSNRSLGYRLEAEGKKVSYVTDTAPCENSVALSRGVDLIIHEATYTEKSKIGMSHTTGLEAGRLASMAKPKKLAIFHFDSEADAAGVKDILDEAKMNFKQTVAAKDGMTIVL